MYIGDHVVSDEVGFLDGVVLDVGELVDGVEGVGVADCCEFVHL